MNRNSIRTILFSTLVGLALTGCCPKEGVDKSFTVADYAIAVDYFSQGLPIEAKLSSRTDTQIEIFNSNAQSEKNIYFNYDKTHTNRIIYYFSTDWSAEQIQTLNLKYRNFEHNGINFNAIEKASFQREAQPYNQLFLTSVSYLDQIECVILAVTEIFIPRAQAMSCKTSETSTISYRAGTLIQVNLD